MWTEQSWVHSRGARQIPSARASECPGCVSGSHELACQPAPRSSPKPYLECSLQGPRGLIGTCGGRLPAAGGINKTACLALTLFLLSGRALDLCFQGHSNRLKRGRGREEWQRGALSIQVTKQLRDKVNLLGDHAFATYKAVTEGQAADSLKAC